MFRLPDYVKHLAGGKLLVKEGFVDLTKLIRSIQRSEGNPDCFQQGPDPCDQQDCAWRSLCLNDLAGSETSDDQSPRPSEEGSPYESP